MTGLVDDHAHPFPLVADTLALGGLTLVTEEGPAAEQRRSAAAPHRLMLEALRVRLAALLDCAPDDVESVRNAVAAADWPAYVRRLFADAGVSGMLLDGGGDPTPYAETAGVPMFALRRLETVIDPLLDAGADADHVIAEVERVAAADGVVGLKTVLAYRTGLAVDPDVGLAAARRSVDEGGPVRRRAKALRDFVFLRVLDICADLRRPIQVHTGFGDSDLRLADSNPLLLDDVLRSTSAPVVLIHAGYPWHEQIAYLASMRSSVWAEFSLVNLFSPVTTADRLLRVIDLAPVDRLLFGSDGHGSPETHWFASLVLRDAWRDVRSRLAGVARQGWLDRAEGALFAGNAVDVYRLPTPFPPSGGGR
ncbi:MAG TPA: amidohydrolase family protein [Pseudonocardiaceae bacterium]|nr:amidohydrolase family protein [Pseudonocardiaceae bacterium]